MILFKTEHVPPILAGTKTQTRRLWPKGPRAKVGSVHWFQTGMKPSSRFARAKILRVWQEPLGDLSHAEALSEGYKSRREYLMAFYAINKIKEVEDQDRALSEPVWCVEFEVVETTNGASKRRSSGAIYGADFVKR